MPAFAKAPVGKNSHKDAAASFLFFVSRGDVHRAFELYVGPNFRHHNPHFRGDAKTLAAGMKENADKYPHKTLKIERILQDGELVAVHSRVQLSSEGPEMALVHIFRFEGDRVAELWDIGQPAPPGSPNEHGMF